MQQIRIFLSFLLFFPAAVYALEDSGLRDKAIEGILYAMETGESSLEKNNFMLEPNGNVRWFANDEAYLSLGLGLGYLKGNTAYDFDHHASELEFPMDNFMAGANFSLGLKNLSLNAQAWASVEDYAGFKMKDKDWNAAGALTSYTKSKAYMDAVIWDANLRYDFYERVAAEKDEDLVLLDEEDWASNKLEFDKIKIGALLGYKYERFDFDMYDLWYQYNGPTTNQGQKVFTYKIEYYLPYLGVAADFLEKNWGFGMNIKYSFYPIARDVDNHLLRYLTFYGDYEKNGQAWMGGIYGFCEFIQNWKLKIGADGTFVRIDGTTWDATHDPAWDKDQSTDTKQWLLWSAIEYKF